MLFFVLVSLVIFSSFVAIIIAFVVMSKNSHQSVTDNSFIKPIFTDPYALYDEAYFFEKTTPRTNPIEFYCDAPTLGVKIPSDDPIKIDVDEVVKYLNRMLENNVENFFGLDNKKMIIQFFNDGDKDEMVIDIPDLAKGGSNQAIISGINQAKTIVRAYYRGEDVFDLADFELMKF